MEKTNTSAAGDLAAIIAKAKDSLAGVGHILTEAYVRDVSFTWEVSEHKGQVVAHYTLESPSGGLDDLYSSIMENLLEEKGFVNQTIDPDSDLKRRISVHAIVTDKPKTKTKIIPKDISIGQLVRFVKSHREAFPNGMRTKICLGDFEGNTFHTKVVIGADEGRVFIAYELNEP